MARMFDHVFVCNRDHFLFDGAIYELNGVSVKKGTLILYAHNCSLDPVKFIFSRKEERVIRKKWSKPVMAHKAKAYTRFYFRDGDYSFWAENVKEVEYRTIASMKWGFDYEWDGKDDHMVFDGSITNSFVSDYFQKQKTELNPYDRSIE